LEPVSLARNNLYIKLFIGIIFVASLCFRRMQSPFLG
jgi:hypothetical protein